MNDSLQLNCYTENISAHTFFRFTLYAMVFKEQFCTELGMSKLISLLSIERLHKLSTYSLKILSLKNKIIELEPLLLSLIRNVETR